MTDPHEPWAPDSSEPTLHVDVGGYEGPLDLLLDLARRQKVDLSAISVLKLAEQYLAFIETLEEKRIELVADYLVMAAWLTYLKSRLLVPDTSKDDEPTGEMLAAILQLRLKRLQAMRTAAAALAARPRLGQSVFARGAAEPVVTERFTSLQASLFDLLKAYASQRERNAPRNYVPRHRAVWSLQEARDILTRLVGESASWISLDAYLLALVKSPDDRATALASGFASSLELVRQGHIDLRQAQAFAPLMMRRRLDGKA